jgi:hypothetical protein
MRVVGLAQLEVEMPGLAMTMVKHCFDKMGIFSIEAKRTYYSRTWKSKLSEANTIINILCWIEEKTNIISLRLCSIEAKSNRLNLCKIDQKRTGLVQNGAGSKRKRCVLLKLQIQSNQSELSL